MCLSRPHLHSFVSSFFPVVRKAFPTFNYRICYQLRGVALKCNQMQGYGSFFADANAYDCDLAALIIAVSWKCGIV